MPDPPASVHAVDIDARLMDGRRKTGFGVDPVARTILAARRAAAALARPVLCEGATQRRVPERSPA